MDLYGDDEPDILFTEGFDEAIAGTVWDGERTRVVYDTELILELFSKLGPKSFSLLEGMFAISIYDTNTKKLYLARDIFGIKPIYYFFEKKRFLFCSEIKGILEIEKK